MDAFNLSGKTVVVIGGSAGIGLKVALAAAQAGASVHVAARGQENLDRVKGEDASIETHAVNAKDYGALQTLFDAIGQVDHVVMTVHESAARLGIDTVAGKMPLDAAAEYFNGKFWSQYRVVQAALPHLAEDGSITLTSGVASRAGMAHHSMIGPWRRCAPKAHTGPVRKDAGADASLS